MNFKFKATPLLRGKNNTQRMMWIFTAALGVLYLFGLFQASKLGSAYLVNAIVLLAAALAGAVGTEIVYALCIKKSIKEFVPSSFGWITALVTVLAVPVDTSWYAVFMDDVIAIFFGKLAFGGFGQNIFNPAAIAKAIIPTSFVSVAAVDAIASATPASRLAMVNWVADPASFANYVAEFGGLKGLLLGNYHGALGETCSLLIIILAVALVILNVIDWIIPVTYVGVCFIAALLVGMTSGLGFAYAVAFVCTGGLLFGAVFMLTEPVTSPITRPGKVVMAALAAFITCLIRFKGNMPEGVVFSILIVNMLTPAINKLFLGNQKKDYSRNMIISLVVVVVCALGTFGIGKSIEASEYLTVEQEEEIRRQEEEANAPFQYVVELEEALANVFEGETLTPYEYTDEKGLVTKVYTCDSGYVFETASEGFEESTIKLVVGIDKEGKVANIICTHSTETEGIGSNVFTSDYFAEQYYGKADGDKIDAYASATYTSKGVRKAVKRALAVYTEVFAGE